MVCFPTTEPAIEELAQNLAMGLADNAEDYPWPPIAPADLQKLLASFIKLCDKQVAAQQAAKQATAAKASGLGELVTAMKADLRYAEVAVNQDAEKLSALGWGVMVAAGDLQPPGEPYALEVPRQGDDWVFLNWKQSAKGGEVVSYKIERRECPLGEWLVVRMALESETTLKNQERGKGWEYRVIATNRVGESSPSNRASAIL